MVTLGARQARRGRGVRPLRAIFSLDGQSGRTFYSIWANLPKRGRDLLTRATADKSNRADIPCSIHNVRAEGGGGGGKRKETR